MIKAEVTDQRKLIDDIEICGVSVEAKGTHKDLVNEVEAIIDTFMEKDDYKDNILHIFDKVVEKEIKHLEKIKKENI